MKLNFKSAYKSIGVLPIGELPNLTIITGENGSGKTHLFNAIRYKFIVVEDIDQRKIAYYTWNNMLPATEQNIIPRNQSTPNFAPFFSNLSRGVLGDLLIKISEDLNLPFSSLSKEHLIGCVRKNDFFLDLPENIQQGIEKIISDYRKCLIDALLGGIRNGSMIVRYLSPSMQYGYGSRENNRHTPSNERINYELDEQQCAVLLSILDKKQDFFNLSEDDYLDLYPLVESAIDPFQGSLSKLFATYINEREKNDLSEIRFRRGDADSFLSDLDFVRIYGLPPWDVLNDVLAQANLLFRFKKPKFDTDKPLEIKLLLVGTNIEIGFGDLSSGERILVALAQFIFLSNYGRQPLNMPELILLDEVDAPLHPSMTADLLRILTKVLVEQYGRRVILATHSPSTVALAPEDSLFVMEKVSRKLRKVSRDEAIHTLTAGVPVLSVKLENRRQVFVESEYDVLYYERIVALLKKQLSPEISFVFIGSGTKGNSSCDQVKTLVKNLTDAGSHIVFGIVDWDLRNNGNEKVRVLGREQRYSIESYLFDPLLVAILAYQLRLVYREALTLEEGQTFADLRGFDNERLQVVVDNTLQWLGFPTGAEQAARACTYINGRTVNIPISYLEMQGHALEARIKSKAPVFNKFNNDSKLKLEILDKVLYELPGFLSRDFLDLLSGIQTS